MANTILDIIVKQMPSYLCLRMIKFHLLLFYSFWMNELDISILRYLDIHCHLMKLFYRENSKTNIFIQHHAPKIFTKTRTLTTNLTKTLQAKPGKMNNTPIFCITTWNLNNPLSYLQFCCGCGAPNSSVHRKPRWFSCIFTPCLQSRHDIFQWISNLEFDRKNLQ